MLFGTMKQNCSAYCHRILRQKSFENSDEMNALVIVVLSILQISYELSKSLDYQFQLVVLLMNVLKRYIYTKKRCVPYVFLRHKEKIHVIILTMLMISLTIALHEDSFWTKSYSDKRLHSTYN